MLANDRAVAEVIGRPVAVSATPATPVHWRPSGNTIAAEAPGTPVSVTFWFRRAWRVRARVGVRAGAPDRAALAACSPQPQASRQASARPVNRRRAPPRSAAGSRATELGPSGWPDRLGGNSCGTAILRLRRREAPTLRRSHPEIEAAAGEPDGPGGDGSPPAAQPEEASVLRRSHPRPASVDPIGVYSQPRKPS